MQSKGRMTGTTRWRRWRGRARRGFQYPARVKCALLSWMAWKDATARPSARRKEDGMSETIEMKAGLRKKSKALRPASTPSWASTSSTSA
ncbi:hypothetical protein SALBM311S_01654 [Streptomyces alboniger]